MSRLERMFTQSQDEREPGLFACVNCVAAGLPTDSRLLGAYEAFMALPLEQRMRALRRPAVVARYVAKYLALQKVPAQGSNPAWGVVLATHNAIGFAARVDGVWWARSDRGVVRVDETRVLAAWEVA